MSTSTSELVGEAVDVRVTERELTVGLADGRTLSVPLAWYPRLVHGTPKERKHWELIADGEGIHWPDLDEDISVAGLLMGRPSGESERSFNRWLAGRPGSGKRAPRRVNKKKQG